MIGWLGRRFADDSARLAFFYSALNFPGGVTMAFWPVFLLSRGLTIPEIGLVNGLCLFLRTGAAPMLGFVADRYLGLRRALVILAVLTVVVQTLFWPAVGFWPILAVALGATFFSAALFPLIEAITLRHQLAGRLVYGRIRMWGSLTFVVMSLLAGFIFAAFGVAGVYGVVIVGGLLIAAAAMLQRPAPPLAAEEEHIRPQASELLRIVLVPPIGLAMLSAAMIDSAHGLLYAFGTIHWQRLGLDGRYIGFLWAIGTLAEVILFALAAPYLKRHSGLKFIALGGAAAVVRWLIMALSPPALLLPLIQLLHAFSYGATHIGLVTYLSRAVPQRLAGSIQGTYAALAGGIVMGGSMMVSGPLFEALGPGAFLAMAALATLGFVTALVAMRAERLREAAVI